MTNQAGPNQREATPAEIAEIKQYYETVNGIDRNKYNANVKVRDVSRMSYLGAGFLLMASFVGAVGTMAVDPYSNNPSVTEHRVVEEKLRNLRDYQNRVPSFSFAPELKPALENVSTSLDNLVQESKDKLEALEKAPDYVQDKEWMDNHGNIFCFGAISAVGFAFATLVAQLSLYGVNSHTANKKRRNVLRPSCLDSQD